MFVSVWVNSSEMLCDPKSFPCLEVSGCPDVCALCSYVGLYEDSPGTCTKEYRSSLLSKSFITFSTSTCVLSCSISVPSTHSFCSAYCSISRIL